MTCASEEIFEYVQNDTGPIISGTYVDENDNPIDITGWLIELLIKMTAPIAAAGVCAGASRSCLAILKGMWRQRAGRFFTRCSSATTAALTIVLRLTGGWCFWKPTPTRIYIRMRWASIFALQECPGRTHCRKLLRQRCRENKSIKTTRCSLKNIFIAIVNIILHY